MPILTTPLVYNLLHKAIQRMRPSGVQTGSHLENDELKADTITTVTSNPSALQTFKNRTLIAQYQKHKLHYLFKGLGYLPEPVLEELVRYLQGATTKQYEHANAHLRLLIAFNNRLKRPLQLGKLGQLRQRFAVDLVSMQSPKVWQQINHANTETAQVTWQDEYIADADDGKMKIRCYQNSRGQSDSSQAQNQEQTDAIAMLFFHGGGFCIGDLDTHHEFCHSVCAQNGWTVVSVDYRLAPEYPAPTALRDCIAAYAWLSANCQRFGALPSRLVLAGDSAGGCLATLVAQQVATPTESAWADIGVTGQKTYEQLQHLPQPLAQMPLYPVTDTEIDYVSWSLYGQGLLLDHDDIVVFDAAYLQHSPLSRQHSLISPMLGDNRQVCPSYIVAAELDILHDEAIAYAEQLQQYGISVRTTTVLGAPHGFIHFMNIHAVLGGEVHNIIQGFHEFTTSLLDESSDSRRK